MMMPLVLSARVLVLVSFNFSEVMTYDGYRRIRAVWIRSSLISSLPLVVVLPQGRIADISEAEEEEGEEEEEDREDDCRPVRRKQQTQADGSTPDKAEVASDANRFSTLILLAIIECSRDVENLP